MKLPNARLVAQLQRITENHVYADTGVLLHPVSSGQDAAGQPITTNTETTVACSFTDKPNMESWRDYADIAIINAEARFVGATPANGDRFKVTGRFEGSSYTDVTFEIVGIRDRSPMGYVVALKKADV